MNQYIEIVENAIQSLGIDPTVCRTEEPHKWHLHRGQAQIVMMLRKSRTHKGEERDTLVLVSPVVIVPKEERLKLRLYQLLLKTSHQLITDSFSIATESDGTEVGYISSTYFIGEMRPEEVSFMLDSLSFYAYKFSEELRAEFMAETSIPEDLPPFQLD